jgi:hypothetical protein
MTRTTSEVYISASALACYAWNSSPIDGRYIVLIVPVIGWEFCLPFDFEYVPIPTMMENSSAAVHYYLSIAGWNVTFITQVLKLILEEKRMIER